MFGKHNDFDFIAIGDNTTDAFIKLDDGSAHVDIDHEARELCMKFADKIPYSDVFVIPAVGNSANAAVSASRLGLKTAFISNIGEDGYGKECLAALRENKVSTDFVKINKGAKTNYHYVLWFDDDRTILIKHEKYNYELPDFGNPKWIYFSSMGENSLPFHKALEQYLVSHPAIKFAFQPGTFQMKFGKDVLAGLYKRADIIFCNKEESQRILGTQEKDIKQLLSEMREIGPKIAVITDGTNGAYSFDGNEMLFMRAYPDPKPPYERTGAGDAFSSTVTAALALGLDFKTALKWGPVNSMSVVQYVGAREGLLGRKKIEEFLKTAPEDYEPKAM